MFFFRVQTESSENIFPAYSVAELATILRDKMPSWIAIYQEWGYRDPNGTPRAYGNLAEACAARLITLIEANIITVEQCHDLLNNSSL